jgi:replicative DNA helicase
MSSSSIQEPQLLPHNLEAERAVLGAILLEQTCLYGAMEILSPEDFYLDAHRKISKGIISLQEAESGIDAITLKNELQRSGQMEACGGIAYIMSLTDGLPRGINVRHYAGIIKDASMLRQVIQATNEAMQLAYQAEESPSGVIDSLQLKLLKLSNLANKKAIWKRAPELVKEAYEEIEAIANHKTDSIGLDTGFHDLNKLCQGFHRGDLIVIAGRPGHGKSSILINIIAKGILNHAWRVGLFTIEMSSVEIMKRALYSEAEVDSYRAGSGFLTRDDWRRLTDAAGRISETRLSVDESGGLTIAELRSRAQSLAIDGGLDLIAVDYLQLMSGSGRRSDNRVSEITEITRGLKILAKDLNVPVIACSQLNRSIENDKDRKPILADLRESGSIEQDADVVLFIWREELRSRKPEDAGRAELIIGKQRNGPTGSIGLTFLSKYTKFVDAIIQPDLPEYE